jgi:hypothetical protein
VFARQHRAVLRSGLLRTLLATALVACSATHGSAQEAPAEGEGEARVPAAATPAYVWQPGAPVDLWAAMGITLAAGALTLGVGAGTYVYGRDQHAIAVDPMTTQIGALGASHTANDFALVSTVLFATGGALVGISAIWAVILPFASHPTLPVRASLGPLGFSLSGSF